MGCCLSCFEREKDAAGSSGSTNKETEMATKKSLSVSRSMTAPTIEVKDGIEVSGMGLALVGTTIEQDAAYWENHIQIPDSDGAYELMVGVATKKDRKFYDALEEQEEDSPDANGTDLMRKVPVKNGSVVGVAVQQSDLPMVQFFLDGEPLNTLAINRFRGTVFPAIYLPANEGLAVKLVFNERDFAQLSPHERFGPLIIARGII